MKTKFTCIGFTCICFMSMILSNRGFADSTKETPLSSNATKSSATIGIHVIQKPILTLNNARVSTEKQAKDLTFTQYVKLVHGVSAMESPKVVGIETLAFDMPGFAKKGDVVWEVRMVAMIHGLRAIALVHSETEKIKFLLLPHSVSHYKDPYETTYRKQDLPVGGEFVQNPKDKNVAYYYVNRGQLQENLFYTAKATGLYRSVDAGKTWRLLVGYLEFKKLFIHPNTGELFAIVKDNPLTTNEDGFLTVPLLDKAITSKDGTHWRDIMGKRQNASLLTNITIDAEHPQRVCLWGSAYRRYKLIAVDDNYTDWRMEVLPSGPPF